MCFYRCFELCTSCRWSMQGILTTLITVITTINNTSSALITAVNYAYWPNNKIKGTYNTHVYYYTQNTCNIHNTSVLVTAVIYYNWPGTHKTRNANNNHNKIKSVLITSISITVLNYIYLLVKKMRDHQNTRNGHTSSNTINCESSALITTVVY